jgi:hypothetical protein
MVPISKPKIPILVIFEGLEMEKIGIFYCRFMAIWYTFPHFGQSCQEKSGNPGRVAALN